MTTQAARLSKSRFVTGCQCHKLLWWTVHEPDAVELQPDKVLQDLFDQGRQVGEVARTRYPGGVLIDLPHDARAERVAATRKALDEGAPAVFEATFIADNTYVAIDVLEKQGDGYRLTEVKSSTSQKDEHVPDVVVQVRVDFLQRLSGGGGQPGAGVVRQVDQHAARIARAGHFAHLAALVEQVLQNLVGLQLDGVRLVHGPPEQLVALATGDKAGFGEARGLRGHGAKRSDGV